jgi:hypothetical protein
MFVLGQQRFKPDFSERVRIVTPAATLVITGIETVALWEEGAQTGANRIAFLEFRADDVDADYKINPRTKSHSFMS